MNTPVGQMIRDARKSRRLTLRDLAPRVGIHYAYLSQVETGAESCSDETLIRLAEELDLDPDWLLIQAGRKVRPYRLLGNIAAGQPIEAVEDVESFDLQDRFDPAEHFLLRVRGNSMIDDGINDGDLAIVRHTAEARSGQTVVAIVDGEDATLKRFSKSRSMIVLTPANRRMKPMQFTPGRVEIRGVLVGVVRVNVG